MSHGCDHTEVRQRPHALANTAVGAALQIVAAVAAAARGAPVINDCAEAVADSVEQLGEPRRWSVEMERRQRVGLRDVVERRGGMTRRDVLHANANGQSAHTDPRRCELEWVG